MSIGLMSGAAAGANLPLVTISDQSPFGVHNAGGACSAGIKVLRNGEYHVGFSNTGTTPAYADVGGDEWVNGTNATVGDSYEVQLAYSSGTGLTVGTADSWLALTSDREFKCSVLLTGISSFVGTLKIRRLGMTADLDTAAISLTATSV